DRFPARAELLVAFLRAAQHEAVAEELLERLAEGVTVGQHGVLAPRRVRAVLRAEIWSGQLQRRAPVLRAVDLLDERPHARQRLSQSRELLAVQTHLARDAGHGRVRVHEPRVAEAGRPRARRGA